MIKTGRIIKGIGGIYTVECDDGSYECSARGRFRKARLTPTVGDNVVIDVLDEACATGALNEIKPRFNHLIRPRVANVDVAVITMAARSPDPDFVLIDKFIIFALSRSIPEIILCFNKSDLADDEYKNSIIKDYSNCCKCLFTSATEHTGIEELRSLLEGKVSVFAGPSGVGKSSLINELAPHFNRQTGELSKKIERGKHTTRQVEFLKVVEHGYIVDSPGFTSLSIEDIAPNDLQHYYTEFEPYIGKCYFNDCVHIHEPDCEVIKNIGENISENRYNRYVQLYKELKQ